MRERESKTLVIYSMGSVFKFGPLFEDYLWGQTEHGFIEVFERLPNKESTCAVFKHWDYILIE